MEVRAIAKDIGIPPRKVRLVTDAVKGRKVNEAVAILKFLPNAAARPVRKVLESAAANAENNYSLDPNELYIVHIVANPARTTERVRPRPHGRASYILRRSSHITVVVSDDVTLIPKSARY